MQFDPRETMSAPSDLFEHDDGSVKTHVKPRFREIFQASAATSFFAYLPMTFWEEILKHTNEYHKKADNPYASQPPVSMDELMRFFGILFYMRLFPRGEIANYWGCQQENVVLGFGSNATLDGVMPQRRFKAIRFALSFGPHVSLLQITEDPAMKLRPLLNILKKTGARYVNVGQNITIDETSVASRSRYAPRLIVYNPKKPTGKYHFKLYMCSCASTWIALNYRLHCSSTLQHRLDGVVSSNEIADFTQEIEATSETRKAVLECVRPFFGSHRVINMDNYYTSVQLLEALRLKGLYARGTVRANSSKHFPRHVILSKEDHCQRGDYRMVVSASTQTLAASWCDGSIVCMISNADPSTATQVARQVRQKTEVVDAPVCIHEYSRFMQGVDRLDQTRDRFSLADGHSFRKWYKKLGLALVDIARCNAFYTWKLVRGDTRDRDQHRAFVSELASQLLSGKWESLLPDERFLFDDDAAAAALLSPVCASARRPVAPVKQLTACTFVSSKDQFKGQCLRRRNCIVCRYEGQPYPTIVTIYCLKHKVSLCNNAMPSEDKSYYCPHKDWSCWRKYHEYYLPRQLFTANGRVRRSSAMHKKKKADVQLLMDSSVPTEPLVTTAPAPTEPPAPTDQQAPIEQHVALAPAPTEPPAPTQQQAPIEPLVTTAPAPTEPTGPRVPSGLPPLSESPFGVLPPGWSPASSVSTDFAGDGPEDIVYDADQVARNLAEVRGQEIRVRRTLNM